MKFFLSLLFAVTSSFASLADAATPVPNPLFQPGIVPPPLYCGAQSVQLCGQTYTLPGSPLGAFQSITFPDRFVVRSATLQCVIDGYNAYFRPTPDFNGDCSLRPCSPSTVLLCDKEIAVQSSVPVGSSVRLSIAPDLLARDNALPAPDIYAQCDVVDGTARYQILNPEKVSCNIFACQPTELSACGIPLTISVPADLGAAGNVETVDHHQVRIECVGTLGYAPHYEVVGADCDR